MEKSTNSTSPKIKIRNRFFLGEFKIEDYLQKEVAVVIEKYK